MKVCTRCKLQFPLTNFSIKRHNSSNPKRQYHAQCKQCISLYYRQWYAKNGRSRATDYREAIYEWKQRHKDGEKARSILWYQERIGNVKRPLDCMNCGEERRLCGHHEDYSKPVDVLWFCYSCHKRLHNP